MTKTETAKHAAEAAAGIGVVAAIVGWLPSIAAGFAIALYVWRFWHDADFRRKTAAAWTRLSAWFRPGGPA
jgi:hypothetical protein